MAAASAPPSLALQHSARRPPVHLPMSSRLQVAMSGVRSSFPQAMGEFWAQLHETLPGSVWTISCAAEPALCTKRGVPPALGDPVFEAWGTWGIERYRGFKGTQAVFEFFTQKFQQSLREFRGSQQDAALAPTAGRRDAAARRRRAKGRAQPNDRARRARASRRGL